MPSPGQSSFDGNPAANPPAPGGYRGGLSDGGAQLVDDTTYGAPDPGTMPTSAAWNYFIGQLASLNKMVPCAVVAITAGASPAILSCALAANNPPTNPCPISIWRGAAGDYILTYSGIASTWQATTAYTSTYPTGSFVVPKAAPNGFYFRCTTSGTSGSTEPTWTNTIGSTVNDGTAVWTCWGPVLAPGLPISGQPSGFLNVVGGAHNYSIETTNVTGGVRVTTQQDGVLTDLNFSVDFF